MSSSFARLVTAGLLAVAPGLALAQSQAPRPAQRPAAAAPAAPLTVALPPFYQRAQGLTPRGKLGEVLQRESVATSIPNAQAWRIAYVSSDAQERPTIATALVIAPRGPMPQAGRAIISWAHGTTGTAANCGPSQMLDPAQGLNQYFSASGNSWNDFGVPGVETFIQRGQVVVATDYQGLGGPGAHQYAIAATNGRDAINAIRAAGAMGLSGPDRRAIIYGWSQGGGATVAAASLGDYIARRGTAFDGIQMRGFVAMAPEVISASMPPGELTEASAAAYVQGLISSFSGSVFDFAHMTMSIWGAAAAFPNLQMTDIFTADGARELDALMRRKCIHVLGDTLSMVYGTNYRALVSAQPTNPLNWARGFVAGSVAPVRPVAPVVIYWGTHDVTVPPAMGAAYQRQMCGLGGDVTRVQLPGAQTHYTTPGVAEPMYLRWIADRLAGAPAPQGCAEAQ
jgi:pimeloyl-ACP methyl ester carboxylesterase